MEEFPDVQHKLAAPKKLSAFEKERQAAALKQQRAEEENAAALREFEDSFANEGDREERDGGAPYGRDRGPPSGPRGRGYDGPRGRGAMPPMGPRSGPGSLGPLPPQRSGPGSLGPMHAPPQHAAARPPSAMPFGAEKPREERPRFSMRNAPPPGHFAPPDSYDSPSRPSYRRQAEPDAAVTIKTPLTIAEINTIHMVADYLLQMRDPMRALKAEALLMRIPAVRQDERMAFFYDSRSAAGLYYRWLLWASEDADDAVREAKRRARGPERIFNDVPIDWYPPNPLPFPDLKSLADAVTDIDYESSDEESSEDEGDARQYNRGPQGDNSGLESSEKQYLTPLKRARLVFLLARLPTSIARLRKGDVARVTNFAIRNAGAGAEEIVDTLLLNVAKPFCYSLAAKFEDHSDQDEEDVYEPDEDLSKLDSPAPATLNDPSTSNASKKQDDDGSNAKLIGIYIISDILSASSTAGVRNAWRYRQLFEAGFKAQKTFALLGRLEKELSWGRIKGEQWKRKVEVVFATWEGWSVFSGDVMEELKQQFFGERREEVARAETGDARESSAAAKEHVKVGDVGTTAPEGEREEEDIDGVPMSDSDED